MLRPPLIEQRKDFGHGRGRRNRRDSRVELPGTKVANTAVVEFGRVIAVIGQIERRCTLMLEVPEVGGDLGLLERAIGGSRREGELEGQEQEEENGENAAHGRIMAEVRAT